MSADPELLAVWTRGWALTRGVTVPTRDDGGWRIEVGADELDAARPLYHGLVPG
ncbi:hypothetical protein BH10PSE2_BH10PSE2_12520 [soil metagenome]